MNSKIKVIILAGGQGKRLRPLTDDIPNCLVEVFGKSIIEHQIDCLNSCGITDITVITGYRAEKIKIPNLKYVKNVNYENTNMAYAIFLAEEVLTENVIICYGDIIFEKDVLQKIIDSNECGIFHISGDDCISRFEFAKIIAKKLGFDENLVKPSNSKLIEQKISRPQNSCLNNNKIKSTFGIKFNSISENLDKISKNDFTN